MRRLSLLLLVLGACASAPEPDYARPLPPGARALRRVHDPLRWPDLRAAFRDADAALLAAMDRSVTWFAAPSTEQWFPLEGVDHRRAEASVRAARELFDEARDADEFDRRFREIFECWESVGWDGSGTVFFTGYFAPVFDASRERTARFRVPIHRRPDDLATDPQSGKPLGRKLPDGGTAPYATRAELARSGALEGLELAWLEDELAAYLIHVNGSAKLRLRDGSTMFVGYAGKTDRPYRSLGRALEQEGLAPKGQVNLALIKRLYREQPARVEELMLRNESYVFFREADGDEWPAGSLGFRVAGERSLATDKKIFPRAGLVFVETREGRRIARFMLDQDTGGAIRAPGRADIFMGIGGAAEERAGAQKSEGRLFYFFVRPELIGSFLR